MSTGSNRAKCSLLLRAMAIWLSAAAGPLAVAAAEIVPVNIFGDGDPLNGVEDDRRPVTGAVRRGDIANDRHLNAGTLVCDGRFRGTAMVIDTREFHPQLKGAVLVTAAHVLYDLKRNRLFRRCDFYFMGWKDNGGYRARIALKKVRMGDFDPRQVTSRPAFGEGDWAFLYLPEPWKKFNPDQSLKVREFAFSNGESYQQAGGAFRLVAFDSRTGVMTESANCTVIESESDDLGGGAWRGQLLDDCDSEDGASGGGIIGVLDGRYYLIGIRSGSHWSQRVYPDELFPAGPPAGALWDRRYNTNFGRAFDAEVLKELADYIHTASN